MHALNGGEWSASYLGHITPEEIVPVIHWRECDVGSGYTAEEKDVLSLPRIKP
jgi:hypothetical protein